MNWNVRNAHGGVIANFGEIGMEHGFAAGDWHYLQTVRKGFIDGGEDQFLLDEWAGVFFYYAKGALVNAAVGQPEGYFVDVPIAGDFTIFVYVLPGVFAP